MITGAGGQLGRDLQDAFAGEHVEAFDHAALDIGNRDSVSAAVRRAAPNWVINAAAFNDVDGAERDVTAAFRVNADGPGHLAAATNALGSALLHVSTDYVFDGAKGAPYLESDAPHPLSVYGRSKLSGERRVLTANANALVIRTAWLYGRHGKNFVKSILAAADKGGPLRVVADQRGSPTSTADLAMAIRQLVKTTLRGLLHAANAGSCSRYEFARAIVGTRAEVLPISSEDAARPAPRPADATLGSERWSLTGLPPLRPWEQALAAFLNGS